LPNNIRFTSYRLSDSQGQPLFESDFSAPLSVKPNIWDRVIADLTSFTPSNTNTELTSQLNLVIDDTSLEIKRADGQVSTTPTDVSVSSEQSQLLSEVIGNEATDKESLLKVLPNILAATPPQNTAPTENPETKQIVAQLVELAGERGAELINLKTQIRAIEAELNGQRRIDELQMTSSQMEKEISDIDEKLLSVNQLAERQKQIEVILARYGKLLQADLENEGNRLKSEISSIRQGEISQTEKQYSKINISDAETPKRVFLGKPLIGLAAALGILGLIAFLLLRDSRILFIGITFAVLEAGILLLINLIPAAVATEVSGHNSNVRAITEAPTHDRNRISLMERFFVDKAWVNALRAEFQSLGSAMKSRLGAQDYTQLKQLRELVQTEFLTIKSEIEVYKTKEIPPEDYLRKRREIDTLKIQRSRIDNELATHEDASEIRELVEDWEDAQSGSQSSFVAQLSDDYVDIVSEKGQLLAARSKGAKPESVDFSNGDLLAIYLWLRLDAWSRSPVKPLIFLTNLLSQLSTKAQAAINARIVELASRGQLITVTINT
jgi:hypothetical protein